MTDKTDTPAKTQIWKIVETINRTCKEGKGFDRLGPFYHDRVVMVPPGLDRRVEGKATGLRYYEDACSKMTIHRLDGSDERIDVWDNTAVVTYKYDCVWDFQGKTFTDDGHEIQVFVRDAKDWQMAWRTVIPGSRRIQACPTKQNPSDREAVVPSGAEGSIQTEAAIPSKREGPIPTEADVPSKPLALSGVEGEAERTIRQTCLDLMATLPACQLTTIDADGFPQTTAMNNLRCAKEYPSLVKLYEGQDNDFLLYLSTSQQSDKMARIRANPKVSVYFCLPDQFIGLMLGGRIEIITDQALKDRIWQKGWTLYYPNGPEGEEYGVLRLTPTTAKGWFQGRPFDLQLKGSRG